MAIEDFGVTHQDVSSRHFPQLTFSATSNPTATAVDGFIEDSAADLAGALVKEGMNPSALAADIPSAAYVWCATTIRMAAALEVMRGMTGQDPAVVQAWERKVDRRLKDLDAYGAAALGISDSSSTTDANGPRTHIDAFGLTTSASIDVSSALPTFRKDDAL